MKCQWHLCDNELSGRAKKFCSLACKNKFYVTKNRKSAKQRLVEHFGGECVICGYNKSVAAMQFHHPNPDKEFGIAQGGHTRSWSKLLAEAEKCILVCANCHAEEHERLRA